MEWDKFFSWVMLGVLGGLILYTTFYLGSFTPQFKTSWELQQLKDTLITKNLTLLDFGVNNNFMSDKNLSEFGEFVKENYIYSEDYDCKYWALEWGVYALKHNIEFKFITTKTHIFIMFEYPDKYCIIDGKQIDCYYYKRK